MAIKVHNEESTVLVDVSFFDAARVAQIPTTAVYRVDDDASGENIVPETPIPGSMAATMQIEITPEQNAIVETVPVSQFQLRIVTVAFTYGSAKQGTAEYPYKLRNLRFYPTS